MDPTIVGGIGLVAILVLFLAGMSVAFALAFVGFVGTCYLVGLPAALGGMGTIPYRTAADYVFTVIPLFVLMGYFSEDAGVVEGIYASARHWFGSLPGGLAMATIAGCAGFGAACGASVATAAIMGKIAIPEMDRYGYDTKLSAGCVASASGLASLIPPSSLMVIYAAMTEQSVDKVLIAGFIPGIVSAILLMLLVYFMVSRNPKLAPPIIMNATWKSRLISLKRAWGLFTLATIIIGGIYAGVFTPTEAAAVAAGTALIMSLVTRRLTWGRLKRSLFATAQTTSMILVVIIGALLFTRFLTLTEIPFKLSNFLSALPVNRFVVLSGIMVMYVILGCFLDAVSMMLLTLPLVFPVILNLGFSPIWFGVLLIVVIEIGLITPPLGLNVYVVAGVAPHIPMEEIFRGIFPFFLVMLLTLAILIAFPQIALVLPNMMK